MAESICRALRDGALEGEHAPALTIKDSVCSPFGFDVFIHILIQLSLDILAAKSSSQGLLLIVFSRSPKFYVNLLKNRGIDLAQSHKRVRILDCYTDPLGWKDRLKKHETARNLFEECSTTLSVCKNVRDLDKLFTSIIEFGLVFDCKGRFAIAIDSVSELLRHASMPSVTGFLSNIRSHDKISSAFWRIQLDNLSIREAAAFEYISSIVADLEPMNRYGEGPGVDLESLSLQEQSPKGKLNVHFKRRNGRVRIMCEQFHLEGAGIKFASTLHDKSTDREPLLRVQFNLQLSEQERVERARVVLPFEHQGNGKPIAIYDGRKSERIGGEAPSPGRGEIVYVRDSEDERPDSDEDPDDDLDI